MQNLVPDLHTIPQLCGLGEMDQSAYSAPSEFSPPRGPHSMPSNAWTETREHERFARNQQAGSRGYVGLSRMPDVGYESYNQGRSPFSVDSGFNSPRDPVMINNDPAYTRFNGYSRCSSPHTEYNSAKNTPRNNNPNILQHVNHRDMPPQIGPYKLLRHQIPHEDYYQRELMPEQEMSPPIDLQIEEYNDGNVYQVQFKRCYRCVKLPANSPFEIRLGEFVIVEADRGEDLGIVVAIAPGDSPHAASLYASSALSMRVTNRDLLKKIIRIADMNERADLQFKRQQEMTLLEICRGRARDTHALPITLVDAEYQFDRKKLVIYYVSSRYVAKLPRI